MAMHVAAGMRNAKEIKMGSANQMERFLAVLDDYLQHNQSRLEVRSVMTRLPFTPLLGSAMLCTTASGCSTGGALCRRLWPL